MTWTTTTLLVFLTLSLATGQTVHRVDLKLPKVSKSRTIDHDMYGYVLMGISGIANGISEVIDAEPDHFGNGTGWWEANSWKRKYADYDGGDTSPAYLGSKSFMAWTTDAAHFFPALQKTAMLGGTMSLCINERFTWKGTGKRLLIGFAVHGLTSHVVYNRMRYGTYLTEKF